MPSVKSPPIHTPLFTSTLKKKCTSSPSGHCHALCVFLLNQLALRVKLDVSIDVSINFSFQIRSLNSQDNEVKLTLRDISDARAS